MNANDILIGLEEACNNTVSTASFPLDMIVEQDDEGEFVAWYAVWCTYKGTKFCAGMISVVKNSLDSYLAAKAKLSTIYTAVVFTLLTFQHR
jgi:hypothetical protein